jgi:hypothetical protein
MMMKEAQEDDACDASKPRQGKGVGHGSRVAAEAVKRRRRDKMLT